jgi:isopentenyldiphosphate isomerase
LSKNCPITRIPGKRGAFQCDSEKTCDVFVKNILKYNVFLATLKSMDNDFQGADELYDVYDEEGQHLGRATRAEVHSNLELVHRAVHILVFRSNGNIILQKRVMAKDIAPGKWDTSVGGHVDAGEDYITAAYREMEEELGISGVKLEHLYDLQYRSNKESEDVRTYKLVYDGPVYPNDFEIEKVREWTCQEVDSKIGSGVMTKNFELDWEKYKQVSEQIAQGK